MIVYIKIKKKKINKRIFDFDLNILLSLEKN
jgi:hypothetical protein